MADQFEEDIGSRVAALETRVTDEAESVKEHFAELQKFITFTVTAQVTQLKDEFKRELGGVEQRLEQRLGERIDAVDRKLDAHHDAMKVILSDILSRLPATHG